MSAVHISTGSEQAFVAVICSVVWKREFMYITTICAAVMKISVKGERKKGETVHLPGLARGCGGNHCTCTAYMIMQGTRAWWLYEAAVCAQAVK